MNFFEILYARKNGAALPANFFDLLFAKSFTPAIEWGEYDGTLPAQYSANGSTLADYRVYGAAGGVGDDSGTEYGYEVDMSVSDGTTSTTTPIYVGDTPLGEDEYVDYGEGKVYRRTENLFDIKTAVMGEYWIDDKYNTFTYHMGSKCYFIPVLANTSYTVTDFTEILPSGTFVFRAAFTNEIPTAHASYVGTTYLRQRINSAGGSKHTATLTNVNYVYLAVQITAAVGITNNVVISEGTTAPEQYIPYLQPTDPPVALPALPTVDGTNIVDYAGQSAAPSRFYAKYQKG